MGTVGKREDTLSYHTSLVAVMDALSAVHSAARWACVTVDVMAAS